jgi:hypothetical protein
MESQTLFRRFTQMPAVRDLPHLSAQAILSLRYAIICRRAGYNPLPEWERRWGSAITARRFYVLVEAIGHVWPDPFAVAPPCCAKLSFDEGLLASLITSAAFEDRRRFDLLSAEMLGCDARDMLYACIQNFVRIAPPPMG